MTLNLRLLVIDEDTKAKVKQVLDFAASHPYEPPDEPPGDNPHHVVMLNTYRCVFSFTKTASGTYRDLSISVPAKGKYPNPIAAFTIARLFGFTGWDGKSQNPPLEWVIAKDLDVPTAIRIVQKLNGS